MIQWERQWARVYTLHRMENVMLALFSKWATKFLGRRVKNIMVFKEGVNTVFCQDKIEKEKALDFFYQSISEVKSYRRFKHSYLDINKRFLEFGGKVFQIDFSKWSDHKLIGLFKKFSNLHHEHMLISQWIFFYLAEVFPERIKKEISPLIQGPKLEEYLKVIFTPTILSQTAKEHRDLLKIASDYRLRKNQKEIDKKINFHTLKYQWIPVNDFFLDKPWTKNYFSQEFKKILKGNPSQKLKEINKKFNNSKNDWKKILGMKIWEPRQKLLLKIAHSISFYKDDRDDNRRKAYFYLKKLYQEIAKRLGITLKDLSFLSTKEILEALKSQKIPLSLIRKRKKLFLLLLKNGEIKVLTGLKARVLIKRFFKKETKFSSQKISGIIVFQGKIRGRVKIVKTKSDLIKVKKDNVMVSVTTHPDFVPAMRKSGAIVTDEGGLLSHAAIVSRELKIPCIVGTKIATKVLKDGDLVEVDANKGFVKIIKKK